VERMGVERGRQEGRQEGRNEGIREALRRIVQARFGAAPEALEALERRIAEADREALDQMLDRVIIVGTVDDL